jgi:hypothetical protein
MIGYRGASFFIKRSINALKRVTTLILVIGALMTAGAARAQVQDPCPSGKLPTGSGLDIVIDKECHVIGGTYNYHNVNIVMGGSLIFDEGTSNPKTTDFWASSILVEKGGGLLAGASPALPFGTNGGVLTIHLYGGDQGKSGVGITCKSTNCGIPSKLDPCPQEDKPLPGQVRLPGGVCDRFYEYMPLPFDDGKDNGGNLGYFGYKVLAVSYGGTLKLFGKKGSSFFGPVVPKSSGSSWARLVGTILPGAKRLTVTWHDWQIGDHIVVTTTDYLPNHSEELVICSISAGTIDFDANANATTPCKGPAGVRWAHHGLMFGLANRLPGRLKIPYLEAETRAAVGLLTRSIRIVSEGSAFGQGLPAQCTSAADTSCYFGGHVIARQGFEAFQIQGVEFRQLGQGGKLGHYPIHFHMARKTPKDTFVMDSSINESMTRWIVVHATQGVTLARNVGYRSIGHGFYLEDAVETDNKFYSNLGIFARAAIQNADNPRNVPGILAAPESYFCSNRRSPRYYSDTDSPAVFWITNGWNDFQGNMAAGAGMCGVCFWELPASISGDSRDQIWESYASEQKCAKPPCNRTGTTPLKIFDGNYCSSAMNSFQVIGYTQNCPGFLPQYKEVQPVANPYAPKLEGKVDLGTCYDNNGDDADKYYPKVDDGQLNQATTCPNDKASCETVTICNNNDQTGCVPTVINDYTTSFNWAEYNFSAIWLKNRWHLVSNSFISDVQNAGLNFVSGGDFTHAGAIKGLWELALKTVFVGQTHDPKDPDWGFASVLSPFYNEYTKLTCDNNTIGHHCLSLKNSFVLGGFTGFGVSQHMFNIYDGPAYEDSIAYLDIKRIDLGPDSKKSAYQAVYGIPKVVKNGNTDFPTNSCYIQNAAIAWKQPNGFYYPPTFHSRNLFFNNVDIFHYVIDPQFQFNPVPPGTYPGTYKTDGGEAQKRYCNQGLDMFNNYSAIDRQTELTDDDGSLTGFEKTISVNEDPFFTAPVEGPECRSDEFVPEQATARTSPYEYVTTVVYPEDQKECQPAPACPKPEDPLPSPPDWNRNCNNENCFGVPLYREYLTGTENEKKEKGAAPQFIRMAGMSICQRETMTVNHGRYFFDLTATRITQENWCTPRANCGRGPDRLHCYYNVFKGGKTYDFFLVYATKDTEQTYQMYVGPVKPDVKPIRVLIDNYPFTIKDGEASALKQVTYQNGILTVTLNLSTFAEAFNTAREKLCVPETFCHWDSPAKKCVGNAGVLNTNLTQEERDIACGYAGKDVDCPEGGCVGFSVSLPPGFVANDQTTKEEWPSKLATCFPKDANWNVTPKRAATELAPVCENGKKAEMKQDFCK